MVGPNGDVITLADLPPAHTARWTPSRKAVVVVAVSGGLLSLDEACRRYTLSPEEFFAWREAIDRVGVAGLKVTRPKRRPE